MKTLRIDDKWSTQYDPANNDKPVATLRHGEQVPNGPDNWTPSHVAMFYALLAASLALEAKP